MNAALRGAGAALLICIPGGALAAADASQSTPVLKALIGLIATFAILAALAFLAKRGFPGSGCGAAHRARVVSVTPLGGRERAVVIELCGRWYLTGVSAGGVTLLAELPQPAQEQTAAEPVNFRTRLRSLLENHAHS